MKKVILMSFLFLVTGVTNAQVILSLLFGDKLNSDKTEFGIDGGLTLSTLQGALGAENRSGLNLGFYFDVKTKNPAWVLSTGLMLRGPMGATGLPVYSLNNSTLDGAFKNGNVSTKLSYLFLPAAMKYTFQNRFFLKGGIQLGLLTRAKDQFLNTIADEDDLTYTLNRKGDFHPVDAGMIAGIGYRLQKGHGMNLGINYYHGLIDAVINDNTPNQYNRAWYFNLGIPIGKGKAEKKQAEKL